MAPVPSAPLAPTETRVEPAMETPPENVLAPLKMNCPTAASCNDSTPAPSTMAPAASVTTPALSSSTSVSSAAAPELV